MQWFHEKVNIFSLAKYLLTAPTEFSLNVLLQSFPGNITIHVFSCFEHSKITGGLHMFIHVTSLAG